MPGQLTGFPCSHINWAVCLPAEAGHRSGGGFVPLPTEQRFGRFVEQITAKCKKFIQYKGDQEYAGKTKCWVQLWIVEWWSGPPHFGFAVLAVAIQKVFHSASSLQLSVVYSLELPREKAATEKAMLPELGECAEMEQIKLEAPEKLYLDVCIGFRFWDVQIWVLFAPKLILVTSWLIKLSVQVSK